MSLSALLILLSLAVSDTPTGIVGRVVNTQSGAPIAGAAVAIVSQRGSVTTDGAGRFRWQAVPPLPADIIITFPGGQVARPVRLTEVDPAVEITLSVDPSAVNETLTVPGAAPTIDVSPGAATTLLTAADLALRHPATLAQALDVVAGVSTISEGQAAVPAIRGMARGRTLILVDGSRATTERRAGANASFLDPGVIQALEVARGPGSVAYGSDTFGGIIAARTRHPSYERAVHVRVNGTLGAGVPEQRGDVEVSRGHGTGGILVGMRVREFEDYDAPAGRVTNSGWRDAGARVRWDQLTRAGFWSIGWQSDLGRSLGRPRSDSNVILATSPYEDSHRLTASLEKRSLGGFSNVRFDGLAGGTRQRTDQDRLPTPVRPRSVERADLSSSDLQLRLTGERRVGPARLHLGTDVGGEYGLHALDSTIAFDAADTVTSASTSESIDSAHRTAAGVFAETSVEAGSRLRFTGGLRFDAVQNINSGGYFGSRSVSNAAVAGLLAATVNPFRHLAVTGQVARGFRDPTLSDRFYRGPVGRGFIEGNPDLKPETSLQVDLRARYAIGAAGVAVAVYHYTIADLVERYAATPTLFLFRNRGRAELEGIEVEAHTPLRGPLDLAVTAETSRGRDALDHTPLDDIAPPAVSIALRHHAGARLVSYVRVKAVRAHDAAGPSEVPTGAYTMVDGALGWRWTERLQVLGTIRNLLDEAYQSSGGPRWVWAPGRHGSITLVFTH
ncbi:MAG TPA: TonB-dependent receptor [Vicinamibacterales bacterium]|nr:TonB-dependent receptor [Vicinamibacterales bacterium]